MTPPATSAAAGRLQRTDGAAATAASGRGLDRRLVAFEGGAEANTIERLAEADILLTLQLQGFDVNSPEWRTFAHALAEYGYAVFIAWGVTGTLRRMAARHAGGRGVLGLERLPERIDLDEDQARGLAAELVTHSLESFRKTLASPKYTWRPDGGASIKTYFIGRCLMDLPDVFQKWWKHEQPLLDDLNSVDALAEDDHPTGDPARVVEDRDRLDRHFRNDSLGREMFVLKDQGYDAAEIAEMLTDATGKVVTEAAVWTRMTRLRARSP
jgi:hypothetical protein